MEGGQKGAGVSTPRGHDLPLELSPPRIRAETTDRCARHWLRTHPVPFGWRSVGASSYLLGMNEPGAPSNRSSTPQGSSAEDCPFCRIPAHAEVAGSEHGIALVDAFPITPGHTLVVPRIHVASLFQLPPEVQCDLWLLVTRVRSVMAEDPRVDGFTVGVNDGIAAGQTVPHAHIHVVPRRTGDVPDPRGGVRWVVPDRAAYWGR